MRFRAQPARDPGPDVRKAAATKMGNAGDRSALPALAEALGRERERWARHAIEEAMALIDLRARTRRRAPPPRFGSGIAQRHRARPAARRRRGARAPPAQAARARGGQARGALGPSCRPSRGTIFQGVSAVLHPAPHGAGLAIVFGLMGVINTAHGELMALGAYATFVVQGWFAAHAPGASIRPPRGLAGFVPGRGGGRLPAERGVIRFLYGGPRRRCASTWGVSLHDRAGPPALVGAANVDVPRLPMAFGAASP